MQQFNFSTFHIIMSKYGKCRRAEHKGRRGYKEQKRALRCHFRSYKTKFYDDFNVNGRLSAKHTISVNEKWWGSNCCRASGEQKGRQKIRSDHKFETIKYYLEI